MKATAERIEKNTVVLEVEVDAEQFSRAVDKAYRKLVKKVNIPGFRRGKAPRVVLENYVGKGTLYSEAVEIVVPDAYVQALEDTGIEPITQPEVELLQVEEGKPIRFKATVKVKPEVKLGQYKGLEVTKPDETVTDEDVEAELKKMQERYAKIITIEEGQVEKGDIVTVDFAGRVDGEAVDKLKGTDYTLEVGGGGFIPGVGEQLVGMSVGETQEIKVVLPDDYPEKDVAGKEVEFTVTVKGLKRKELAPLDDEFAKDVSEFDTLQELREDILNRLKQAASYRARQQIGATVVKQAVDNAEVDIPEEMISARVEEMISDIEMNLAAYGLTVEKYLERTNISREEWERNLRADAERGVKTALVLEAIAKAEKIEVTDEELEEEIKKMGEKYQQDPAVLRKILEGTNRIRQLKSDLATEKTVNFLVENAVIKESEVPGNE